MRRVALCVAAMGLAIATGCGRDTWQGLVYPSAANLLDDHQIGYYSTLEDCRTAARSYMSALGVTATGDYECGKNCKLQPGGAGLFLCEETAR